MNIEKRKIITKIFFNSEGGWMTANLYAKENNLELLTTCKDFHTYKGYNPYFYSFTFITK